VRAFLETANAVLTSGERELVSKRKGARPR